MGVVSLKADAHSGNGDGDGTSATPFLPIFEGLTRRLVFLNRSSDCSPTKKTDSKRIALIMNEVEASMRGVGLVSSESLPSRQSVTGAYVWDKASRRAVCQPERESGPGSPGDDVYGSEIKTSPQCSLLDLLCCASSRVGLLQGRKSRNGLGQERRWLLLLCVVVD